MKNSPAANEKPFEVFPGGLTNLHSANIHTFFSNTVSKIKKLADDLMKNCPPPGFDGFMSSEAISRASRAKKN